MNVFWVDYSLFEFLHLSLYVLKLLDLRWKFPSSILSLKQISADFFLFIHFFYSVICTELMFSVGSCDIWKRHDSKYSSVRCAVYRMGRISRNRGNPRDLVLITKWIWDALIISSTPFRQEAASLHLLLLLPVVCELTSNYITSNILISRILPF